MFHTMFWRFLPKSCTDPKTFGYSTINAAAPNLMKSGMWRDSFLERRCLVPVDTFIEWEHRGKRSRPGYTGWLMMNSLRSEASGLTGDHLMAVANTTHLP